VQIEPSEKEADVSSYDSAPTDSHTGGKLTFEMWIEQLESIMREWITHWENLPYRLPLADSTGLDCWRDMYDDGISPIEAFWADQESWA